MKGELTQFLPPKIRQTVDSSFYTVASLLAESAYFGEHDDPSKTLDEFIDPHYYLSRSPGDGFENLQQWSRYTYLGILMTCRPEQLGTNRISSSRLQSEWTKHDIRDPMGDFLQSLGKPHGEQILDANESALYQRLFLGAWSALNQVGVVRLNDFPEASRKAPLLAEHVVYWRNSTSVQAICLFLDRVTRLSQDLVQGSINLKRNELELLLAILQLLAAEKNFARVAC